VGLALGFSHSPAFSSTSFTGVVVFHGLGCVFDSTDGAATVDEMEKGAGALGIGTPDSIKPFLVLR